MGRCFVRPLFSALCARAAGDATVIFDDDEVRC